MAERLARKLLIIGWDAADWMMIDPLLSRGSMPHLKALIDRGVRADISTLHPKLSPLLWTSIATGKTADKHGILNFVEPDPSGNGLRVASSTSRKTKAIWNILTQSDLKVNAVSWYASHPAEPINGCCVSNLFQEGQPKSTRDKWPLMKDAVHPAACADHIAAARVHPNTLNEQVLRPMLPRLKQMNRTTNLFKTLTKHIAQAMSVHRAAMSILQHDGIGDCTMVFYDTIDTMGHHFMEFHPPQMPHVSQQEFEQYRDVMAGVYEMHDIMLGELLAAAGDDATVMLLSDHGFYSDHLRPVTESRNTQDRAAIEAMWHRPTGVLAMAGPPFKRGERSPGASILDITPTALTLLGLPVGLDMDGRILVEAFEQPVAIETVPSWDDVEGDAGMHPPDMRQDPFAARDAIKQLVDLGYMAALPESAEAQVDLVRRETAFNLGMVLMTTGHPDQAVPHFQQLSQERPDDLRYAMCFARSMYLCSRLEEASAALRTYLRDHPGSIEPRLFLTAVLAAAQRHSEASAELDALELDCAGRHTMDVALGDVCSLLNRWTDAERHYRAAKQCDPTNVQVHVGLARAALHAHRFEEAVEHCLDAVEIQHVQPNAHHLLGVALVWMKDYEHAIQSFNVALAMAPGMIDSHRFLSLVYHHRGDRQKALEHQAEIDRLIELQHGREPPMDLNLEAPMGPAEWARQMGMND